MGVPAGTVIHGAWNTCPSGYLNADGSAVSRSDYQKLFLAIDELYGSGSGDGSTTFNLPNAQGLFIRGAGSQTLGPVTYSGTLGSKQNDQIQGFALDIYDNNSNRVGRNGNPAVTTGVTITNTGSSSTSPLRATGFFDAGYGTPRVGGETRPGNLSLKFCIKY